MMRWGLSNWATDRIGLVSVVTGIFRNAVLKNNPIAMLCAVKTLNS